MNEVRITSEALQHLNRITKSCITACSKNTGDFRQYVKKVASASKDMNFTNFASKAPEDIVFVRDILLFIKEQKLEKIDVKVILKFFGSRWHIDKILSDIKKNMSDNPLLQKDSLRKAYLFDHILTLHYIRQSESGELCSCYQDPYNGECIFTSPKFIVPEKKSGLTLKAGDRVLLHFRQVIAVNPPDEVVKFIFNEQNRSREFMNAVLYLSKKGG